MSFALPAALFSALCYGVAAVFQAQAARETPHGRAVEARLLVRLLRQTPFVAGIVLDIVGFLAQFWALRYLPLFLVQAVQASNLAVTAIVAVPVLHARLARRHWYAIGGVCLGLALLALSAGPERPVPLSIDARLGLLVAVALLAVAGFAAGHAAPSAQSIVLGLIAGLGFGAVAVATRTLTSLAPVDLVRNPATYALAVGGVVAFLFYATGLQRGSVTAVTAAVVVTETAVPAVVGVLLFGDSTRAGLVPLAIAGFVVSIAGALALARFGELTRDDSTRD